MALNVDIPVFARPIEIHSTSKTFALLANATPENVTLTEGTYANLAALLLELRYQIGQHSQLAYATTTCELDSDLRVTIGSSAHDIAVSWTHTALRDLLGFDGGLTPADDSFTAEYVSPYLWYPKFICANQGEWSCDAGKTFSGTVSQSGRIAGSRIVPRYYTRVFDFVFEDIDRVYASAAATSNEQECTFERFFENSLNAYPVEDTVPCKGFYVFHTLQDLLDNETTASYDDGGVDTGLSSSPDEYVFCSPALTMPTISPSIPSGRLYYDVQGFEVRTATAPTWTTPTTP